MSGALNQATTQKEIVESITTCAPCIGHPQTNASLRTAQQAFDEWEGQKDERWGI
ncbi:MAG TPA: hypothetical protein VKF40_04570 [Burkholderiales bacterium]|nr:hypothetical protein [Burkholderiales bacterium]